MFRFFRRLRNRLLSERRFSKYLLYAIGEIMLVVIGILIALQVDTWNQERLKQKDAIIFFENTRQQLLEDRGNLQGQISYNSRFIPQFEYAIDVIGQQDHAVKDSLGSIAGRLIDYSDFDREGTIYETIVNSGDIKLLDNEEIKKNLRSLQETYLYINRMEMIHYDAIMQMIPEISKTISIPEKAVVDANRLYDPLFQNFFALSLRIIHEKEAVYLRAVEEIDFLITQIEEEINKS